MAIEVVPPQNVEFQKAVTFGSFSPRKGDTVKIVTFGVKEISS